MNSIDREMSGDLKEGFKTVGKPMTLQESSIIIERVVSGDFKFKPGVVMMLEEFCYFWLLM